MAPCSPSSSFASMVLRAACLCGLALTCASVASAETLAMLPTSGSADRDVRGRLDVAIRKALASHTELEVQGAKQTGGHMSTLIDLNGEVCENEDTACLAKLGILADVSTLLVVDAAGKRTLEVKLILINVETGTVTRTIDGTVRVGEAGDVQALIDRVLSSASDVPGILDTSATTGATSSLDAPPPVIPGGQGPIDETKLTDLQFAGAAVAGVGGGLAVGGVLGGLACEALFWNGVGSAATRKDIVAPLGAAMWVGAIVGVAASALGGGLFLAGSPATGPKRLE